MDYSLSLSEILVTSLTILAAGLGYIIKEQRDKLKSIRSQLSDKKYNLYYSIYSIFFELVKDTKNSKLNKKNNITERIFEVKKDILIYAPDKVVFLFLKWNRFISNNENDVKHAKIFLELFVEIRKDMGYKKTKISEKDILGMIMTSDNEVNTFYKLIGGK